MDEFRSKIKKILSKDDNIWYPKNNMLDNKTFLNLIEFLEKNKEISKFKSNFINSDNNEIFYNKSIFHFILYFSYHPKLPLIYVGQNCIIFGYFDIKNHVELNLSIPYFSSKKNALVELKSTLTKNSFKQLLDELNIKDILIRDLDDEFILLLKKEFALDFKIQSLKEIYYAIYDLNKTNNLKGFEFSNLRWHLNKFDKANHKIEIIDLKENLESVIHLIGKWKKNSIEKRGFSFIDVKSDKMAARFFHNYYLLNLKSINFLNIKDVYYRVLKIDDKFSSFNLGFPLGIFKREKIIAHAVGICDIDIPHLAEYSQYDFWKELYNNGYNFVNDGPTWRKSLAIYKNKFRPIDKKRLYWIKIRLF